MFQLDNLLRQAVDLQASDIHLCEGQPPIFRIHGALHRQGDLPLQAGHITLFCEQMLPAVKRELLEREGEVDLPYSVPGLSRFRVNIYRQRGSLALALRVIPFAIRSLAELGLPEVLSSFCTRPHGLVVITGPTGSGKSTTLAALIDLINHQQDRHIVTIEEPIEYLHRHKRSIVHQREVGSDTNSFGRALRAALRQDPDVLLLGEMRDLETTQIALQAAETGHLVFTTLHTNDAPATVDRMIDLFPPEQQQQVRVQLAGALQGIVSQRLFARVDKPGRVAALEILVATSAVRNLIREGKSHQLASLIQTGGKLGMRSMEQSIRELYDRGLISQEDLAGALPSSQGLIPTQSVHASLGYTI